GVELMRASSAVLVVLRREGWVSMPERLRSIADLKRYVWIPFGVKNGRWRCTQGGARLRSLTLGQIMDPLRGTFQRSTAMPERSRWIVGMHGRVCIPWVAQLPAEAPPVPVSRARRTRCALGYGKGARRSAALSVPALLHVQGVDGVDPGLYALLKAAQPEFAGRRLGEHQRQAVAFHPELGLGPHVLAAVLAFPLARHLDARMLAEGVPPGHHHVADAGLDELDLFRRHFPLPLLDEPGVRRAVGAG